MKRVLFVCTGNTCRSPMAEAILRALCEKKGVEAEASSAGLYAQEGAPMSQNAVLALEERGIAAQEHRARQLTREMAERADLILTMTSSHLLQVMKFLPEHARKAHTLKAFALGSGDCTRSIDNDIADPFGGSVDAYRFCAREIADCVGSMLDKLA